MWALGDFDGGGGLGWSTWADESHYKGVGEGYSDDEIANYGVAMFCA